jgi:hypothetical protein
MGTNSFCETGDKQQKHSLMHGMSPFDESAGVVPWQTSRVPISALLLCEIRRGMDGGTMMPTIIAMRMITACNLIVNTIFDMKRTCQRKIKTLDFFVVDKICSINCGV